MCPLLLDRVADSFIEGLGSILCHAMLHNMGQLNTAHIKIKLFFFVDYMDCNDSQLFTS